jgi:hypothetical protein
VAESAMAGRPSSVKRCAMKWAWPTLTQYPSARICEGSAIFRLISSTTRWTHAWSAVRTPSSAATS